MARGDFSSQIAGMDTDTLLQAYQGQRNPFQSANKLADSGQALLAQELQRRGVNTGAIRVTPGGKVYKNTGLKSVGKAIGGVLKTVAPAAALIPGVGPVAAGLLAAGGNAAGRALHGDRFDPLKSLGAGALGAGGAALLGGQGISGIGGIPGRLGIGGAPGVGGAATAGSTILDPSSVVRQGGLSGIVKAITSDPERAARLGLGVVGAIQGSQAAGRADDLQRRALAPLFDPNAVNPYAGAGDDPGNPYSRPSGSRTGQRALRAELSR